MNNNQDNSISVPTIIITLVTLLIFLFIGNTIYESISSDGSRSKRATKTEKVSPLEKVGNDAKKTSPIQVEEAEEAIPSDVHTIVEKMPAFPGCEKKMDKAARTKCVNQKLGAFLSKNVKYPAMARENGIDGTVYVGFIVRKDGSISNVSIKRGLNNGGGGCDAEALRVVKKMPDWNPGMQDGEPVNVAYTLPIRFKLE